MIDYFKGMNSIEQIYRAKFEVEEKIHDEMPKYSNRPSFEYLMNRNFETQADFDNFFDQDMNGMSKELRLKEKFNKIGMFCFVSWKWINPLAKYLNDKKCLEVMAGRGWLSYALQQKGINVKATDNFSWHNKMFPLWNDTVTDVEDIDAVKAVEKYGKEIDYLIMAWAYMDNTAYQVIKKLYEVNPNVQIIYIGEGHGGCTADDDFYNHFEIIEDEDFYDNVSKNYQSWEGIHDVLLLGKFSPENIYEGDE